MSANARVAQLVEPSTSMWAGPVSGRQFASPWGQANGFTGEDWNFDTRDVVDGYIYGFGQGRPAQSRGRVFDVMFFLRDGSGEYRVAGFYLNAELLAVDEAEAAWRTLSEKGVLARRAEALRELHLFDDTIKRYLRTPLAIWRARVEDVRVFDNPPPITPMRPTDWRFSNAYDYGEWRGWEKALEGARPLLSDATPERPRIERMSLGRYRAFRSVELELAPITILLGRNNAGKTALCRAPWFFTRAWLKDAHMPFVLKTSELDLGGTLQDVVHLGAGLGVESSVELANVNSVRELSLGATYVSERGYRQTPTHIKLSSGGETTSDVQLPTWSFVKDTLGEHPQLDEIARGIELVVGLRRLPERGARWDGYVPSGVGTLGQGAYAIWADAVERGDRDALSRFTDWFRRVLLVEPQIEMKDGRIDVFIQRPDSAVRAHLLDAGAGLGQALPLIAALTLIPARDQPWLYCVEQPELHLHPRAHGEMAELLAEAALGPQGPRFLIETHSDALVLRLRAMIAEQQLSPDQVALYFVDDRGREGSVAKRIPLNDRGTPEWWPEGVFAEPQQEFLRIRRALAKRDGRA